MYKKVKETNNAVSKQYLTFAISGENYGLELIRAKEIIKPPRITNVPNTEECIMGVINLRGQVIPVIDMVNKMGLKAREKNYRNKKRIIVINIKNMLIGLYVD